MTSQITLVLKNATVVLGETEQEADLHLGDGRILGIGRDLPVAGGAETIDVRGKYVLPGIIDAHVHLREFGYSEREDFYSGTQAAAVGGVTTVLDMPNSKPNVIELDDFKARRDRVLERAYVNIGLYVWACAKNLSFLDQFQALGAVGFKIFTAETGAYDPEFARSLVMDPALMFRLLEKIGSFGGLAAIHSESAALIGELQGRAQREMAPDMRAYLASRPSLVEDAAVFEEVAIAKHTGTRIHICHVVGGGTVAFLRWAKREYYGHVSCEVTPHNLLLTADDTLRLGALAKFSPPVHDVTSQGALWSGLRDGTIDMVGSDHAPQVREKKYLADIWTASPGSPALDYWVPLMLDRVAGGEFSMARFVEVTAEAPAKVFGLYPRKGVLRVGADADLVVVDLNKTTTVDPARFLSKAKYSPFEGWKARGVPVMTLVGGVVVARDGVVVAKPGTGRLVSPQR